MFPRKKRQFKHERRRIGKLRSLQNSVVRAPHFSDYCAHIFLLRLDDEESTTVGGDGNLYDQIFISTHTTYEFGAAKAEYGETIGVIPFDMAPPYDTMNHNTLKVTMSDHRPIRARFRIDQPDDD